MDELSAILPLGRCAENFPPASPRDDHAGGESSCQKNDDNECYQLCHLSPFFTSAHQVGQAIIAEGTTLAPWGRLGRRASRWLNILASSKPQLLYGFWLFG